MQHVAHTTRSEATRLIFRQGVESWLHSFLQTMKSAFSGETVIAPYSHLKLVK